MAWSPVGLPGDCWTRPAIASVISTAHQRYVRRVGPPAWQQRYIKSGSPSLPARFKVAELASSIAHIQDLLNTYTSHPLHKLKPPTCCSSHESNKTLRAASLRRATLYQPVRCLSATTSRPMTAMADGTRPVDDIDLACDYPSEVQMGYTTPAGALHHERIDKEMGYLDQRVLCASVIGISIASLYGALANSSYTTSSEPIHKSEAIKKAVPVVKETHRTITTTNQACHAYHVYHGLVAPGPERALAGSQADRQQDGEVHWTGRLSTV
ncbi:hypothetical protein B0H67DRAFT_648205 [Lasiosphaeris hirsuta]|uniref:Uncharacterized protein n=1 Tax=Lasiosphaeris hirsuta TaxID=260670 RepID=A0AA40A2K0_9PEZI|nr:hypothetical protein B0H67DRAFT_648205 [Lasiosphaeris hirsuta]